MSFTLSSSGVKTDPFVLLTLRGIDRDTLRRTDDAYIQDLISDSRTRFVPVLQERNLIQSGREPKAVFISGMMARALTGSGAELIFLGIVEEQAA